MFRFQIIVNGKPVCTAGVKKFGVLTAIFNWVGRRRRKADVGYKGNIIEESWLSVGGIDDSLEGRPHVRWLTRKLKPGDEITVRILGAGPADPPKKLEYH